jgi:GWxTD domain-containing protein
MKAAEITTMPPRTLPAATRAMKRSVFVLVFFACAWPALACAQGKTSVRELPDRYRTWLQDEVCYIISNEEKDAFLKLSTDQERDQFVQRFWEARNPTPGTPDNAYKQDIYERIAYAKQYLDGVHSAMGQIWVTLGKPQQRAKYYGRADIRSMEIWFYQNTNAALPPYFYILFFDRDNTGVMRLYSPYMDGPSKLATSVLTVNDNLHSYQAIDRALGREVARTTLSLLPDEPLDTQNARASLQSDVMLGIIKNLANHPLTKQAVEQKRAAQQVTHRILLSDEFVDVVTAPLRDASGNFNLHYLLRLHQPSDFAIGQADSKTFLSVDFSVHVYGPDNKLIFQQLKSVARNLDAAEASRVKSSVFGYEGWLALAPGKYKISFLLTNKLTQTAFKAQRDVVVPAPDESGLRLSEMIAFSKAEPAAWDYLPFALGGVKFTPMTGEGLTFAPGQSVNVFYQIWAPPRAPAVYGNQNLTVEYVYGRLGTPGDTKTLHEQVAMQQFDAFGSLVSGKKIELGPDTAPGNYRLMVSVAAPDNAQKVYSSLNLRVSSAPPAAPPFDVIDPDLAGEVARGVPEFDRALCYVAQGDKESALAWFKAALEKDPNNEVARSRLAELYYAKQDYPAVAALYARAPATNETDEQSILRAAESIARTGDVARAIKFLEAAMSVRKSSAPLYIALAGYYRDEGNVQKASQLESKGRELSRQ